MVHCVGAHSAAALQMPLTQRLIDQLRLPEVPAACRAIELAEFGRFGCSLVHQFGPKHYRRQDEQSDFLASHWPIAAAIRRFEADPPINRELADCKVTVEMFVCGLKKQQTFYIMPYVFSHFPPQAVLGVFLMFRLYSP